jgi:hypothetical protein
VRDRRENFRKLKDCKIIRKNIFKEEDFVVEQQQQQQQQKQQR